MKKIVYFYVCILCLCISFNVILLNLRPLSAMQTAAKKHFSVAKYIKNLVYQEIPQSKEMLERKTSHKDIFDKLGTALEDLAWYEAKKFDRTTYYTMKIDDVFEERKLALNTGPFNKDHDQEYTKRVLQVRKTRNELCTIFKTLAHPRVFDDIINRCFNNKFLLNKIVESTNRQHHAQQTEKSAKIYLKRP